MFKLSKNVENRKEYARNTRQQIKFEFKIDSKIGTKYQNSPFYKGCKLWDSLTPETQLLDSMALFKQDIKGKYLITIIMFKTEINHAPMTRSAFVPKPWMEL